MMGADATAFLNNFNEAVPPQARLCRIVASDDRARWHCAGMVDLYGGQASTAVADLDATTFRAWLSIRLRQLEPLLPKS